MIVQRKKIEQLIQRRINQLRLTQDMPNSNTHTHTHSHIYSICFFFGTFYLKIEMFECVRYMVHVLTTVSRLQTSDSGMNPNEPNQILQHLPVAVLIFFHMAQDVPVAEAQKWHRLATESR